MDHTRDTVNAMDNTADAAKDRLKDGERKVEETATHVGNRASELADEARHRAEELKQRAEHRIEKEKEEGGLIDTIKDKAEELLNRDLDKDGRVG